LVADKVEGGSGFAAGDADALWNAEGLLEDGRVVLVELIEAQPER
jgi:hypothetical protein